MLTTSPRFDENLKRGFQMKSICQKLRLCGLVLCFGITIMLFSCAKAETVEIKTTTDISDLENLLCGAEPPTLSYSDDNIAVLYGEFGTIIYGYKEAEVLLRIPFESFAEISFFFPCAAASADGEYLYLYDENLSGPVYRFSMHEIRENKMETIRLRPLAKLPNSVFEPDYLPNQRNEIPSSPQIHIPQQDAQGMDYIYDFHYVERKNDITLCRTSSPYLASTEIVKFNRQTGEANVWFLLSE